MLLTCMKAQLTGCKQGKMKNFGFGSLLCCFFFERVPMMSPRVDIHLHYVRDGTMDRWTEVLPRKGGGHLGDPWDDAFFAWWECQVVVIEDYPYAGIDYHNDPEMPIPPNSAYGDIGKIFFLFKLFHFYIFMIKKENVFVWIKIIT
jgi:hypothetical protein